jgi:5'-nucleotidase
LERKKIKSPLKILLSNDDSYDSPLLAITIDALKELGDLYVVVPADEQSWKGKAMTRKTLLAAESIPLQGVPAWKITGTPADCTNLAMHNLLPEKPDIVVSGTNIGKNVGTGFIFSSGTIGACIEANISGIPAVALSQELEREDFIHWNNHREFPLETHNLLQERLNNYIPKIWKHLSNFKLDARTTWNINFPLPRFARSEIIRTNVGQSYYENCFKPKSDGYEFALNDATIDATEGTDDRTLKDGNISATLLDIRNFGQQ